MDLFQVVRTMEIFLENDVIRTMVIAQTNPFTGRIEGYGICRKTEQTPKNYAPTLREHFYNFISEFGFNKPIIDYYKKNFRVHYKLVPSEGYQLNSLGTKFVRIPRKRGLEKTVATTAIISLIGSILFLSSNITGNVIGNMTNSTSNIIGVVLLVVGLVAGYFYIKNK